MLALCVMLYARNYASIIFAPLLQWCITYVQTLLGLDVDSTPNAFLNPNSTILNTVMCTKCMHKCSVQVKIKSGTNFYPQKAYTLSFSS